MKQGTSSSKGGRPRDIAEGEDWVRFTVCLPPGEAQAFDKIRQGVPKSKFIRMLINRVLRRSELRP